MGIAVLGPLEVDGQANGLSPRDRVVLSALVVRGRDPSSTEALADVLWGDDLPRRGRRSCTGASRGCASGWEPPPSSRGRPATGLTVNETEVDSRRFERLFERAREALGGG